MNWHFLVDDRYDFLSYRVNTYYEKKQLRWWLNYFSCLLLAVKQIFLEHLLFVMHCAQSWGNNDQRDRYNLCSRRAHILLISYFMLPLFRAHLSFVILYVN